MEFNSTWRCKVTVGILLDYDLFRPVCFTLDNLIKKCTSEGLGNHVRQAQVLSLSDEELMWQMGILGLDSSK